MRTFEERKEEIFRRSEQRIVQRKKTVRRALLTCVPAALCLTILSGYAMFRGPLKMENAAPESAMDPYWSLQDSEADSPECMPECPESALGVACMQVSNGTTNTIYSDAELLQALDQILATPESIAAGLIPESGGKNNYGCPESAQIIEGEPYPLLLIYHDGTQVWYTLRGNRLTAEDGTTYQLTAAQSSVLYARVKGEQ